jgi:hypothetical protein
VGAPARALFAASLTLSALGLAACGGRFVSPHGDAARTTVIGGGQTSEDGRDSSTSTSSSAQGGSDPSALPSLPSTGTHPAIVPTTARAGTTTAGENSTQKAIVSDYETYLVDLSGLDDNLSKAYVGPLASVTTNRLAQASVRQAATLLAAQEHGVGTLRDDHVSVVMTGPNSAALADCQDEFHFYLVNDNSGTPDPFIERGYFVGSAQMVLQNGHWLVDVFTTTHDTCAAF